MQQISKQPAFQLGQIVATPGALAALKKAGQHPGEFPHAAWPAALWLASRLNTFYLVPRHSPSMGKPECAGLNRHVVGDARALQERK